MKIVIFCNLETEEIWYWKGEHEPAFIYPEEARQKEVGYGEATCLASMDKTVKKIVH